MIGTARSWQLGLGFWSSVLTLCGSCGSGPSTPAAPGSSSGAERAAERQPGAAPSTPEAEPPDRDKHMQASFWLAVTARDELIEGDLDGAKAAARTLAQHDFGDALPERWRHWVKQMQKQAEEIAVAGDLAGAARSVAALALSCGNCHAEHRADAESERALPLSWQEAETLGERMQRHEIAADQLWVGLIAPSENAWSAGTLTLTRAPIAAPDDRGEPVQPALAAKIEELRGLARAARTAGSHPERAEHYGAILARCASCHALAR